MPATSPHIERSGIAGTFTAFRIGGVPVRFHFTFVLMVIFLVVMGLGSNLSNWMYVAFILGLFFSVLLHELGHSWVSRRYGIKTLEIVMFPIGGIARLERNPKPNEEPWIG